MRNGGNNKCCEGWCLRPSILDIYHQFTRLCDHNYFSHKRASLFYGPFKCITDARRDVRLSGLCFRRVWGSEVDVHCCVTYFIPCWGHLGGNVSSLPYSHHHPRPRCKHHPPGCVTVDGSSLATGIRATQQEIVCVMVCVRVRASVSEENKRLQQELIKKIKSRR